MIENQALYDALCDNRRLPQPLATATIVAIDGPSYRGLGTQIAVRRDAPVYGTISAGCLENDVRENALRCFGDGRSRRVVYDASNEDELVWGMGTGCGGRIEILIEPLAEAHQQALLSWMTAVGNGDGDGVLLQRVDADAAPAHWLLNAAGLHGCAVADALQPSATCVAEVQALFADWCADPQRRRARIFADDQASWLARPLFTAPAVLLIGAGSDVPPLVTLFDALGWRVVVVDHREAFLDPVRFPAKTELRCEPAADFAARPPAQQRFLAAVVKNHHFERDNQWLAALVASDIPYIGVLGPRARFERLAAALTEAGQTLTPEQLARIHAPTGLDLGGETPAEVALSTVAEIQQIRYQRNGRPLREKQGSIHQREQL